MAEEEAASGGEAAAAESAPPKKRFSLLQLALFGQLALMLAAGGILTKVALLSPRPQIGEQKMRERAIASIQDEGSQIKALDLEVFSVNLGPRHMLRTALQLEISNESTARLLRRRQAAVRSRILDVLASQPAEKTSTLQGKLQLKDSIRHALNEELAQQGEKSGVVREVYFLEFTLL